MSDVTPTAAQTIATASDLLIDAAAETVEAAVKPVEAVAELAPVAIQAAAPAKKVAVKTVAPAKKPVVKAAVKTAPAVAKSASAKLPAKRGPKPRVVAPPAPVIAAVRKTNRKAATAVAKRKYVRKAVAAVASVAPVALTKTTSTSRFTPSASPFTQGIKMMDTTSFFAPFASVPGADKFQSLFTGVGEKGQEVVKKSQAFAEQMTEAAKANMEAVVESSKIAAAGARDLGTEIVATTKSSVEHTTAAVKSLTEAKSPTEFFQLQSDMFKASFDRMVADGSKITEHLVKLAGEAVQPLSSRASVNAEKFSELTA